jgi:AcrR family transcriptional regulator
MKSTPGIAPQQSAAATTPAATAATQTAPRAAAPATGASAASAAAAPVPRATRGGAAGAGEPVPGNGQGRLPGAERKAQIVQATLRLVAEYGLVGASMSRIADAVGISNAALYRHFDSREDILIAAHDTLIERVFAWLNSSRAPNVIDRLREMGGSHARVFSKDIEGFNAPMFQFISWIPKDRVRDHVVRRRVEMLQWYADLVEEGKAQGTIRTDIETDLIVAELFAWIWWEDLSYLEGLDTEMTLKGSANMFDRLLARISATGSVGATATADAGSATAAAARRVSAKAASNSAAIAADRPVDPSSSRITPPTDI